MFVFLKTRAVIELAVTVPGTGAYIRFDGLTDCDGVIGVSVVHPFYSGHGESPLWLVCDARIGFEKIFKAFMGAGLWRKGGGARSWCGVLKNIRAVYPVPFGERVLLFHGVVIQPLDHPYYDGSRRCRGFPCEFLDCRPGRRLGIGGGQYPAAFFVIRDYGMRRPARVRFEYFIEHGGEGFIVTDGEHAEGVHATRFDTDRYG